MSQPSCDACTGLREYAPEFVMNGVTENIANSLQSNRGLNWNGTNCEHLQDVVDCLIGRKAQELESLDVCDWKDFMAGFGPNLYETLKAMVMNDCGVWDAMCYLLGIIRGDRPTIHRGEFLDSFKAKVDIYIEPGHTLHDINNFHPTFDADISPTAICPGSNGLGRWAVSDVKDNVPYPYGYSVYLKQPISVGEVIGVVPKSAVPESDIAYSRWQSVCAYGSLWQWYILNSDTVWYVIANGYTTIDGVTFNEHLSQYGYDNLVLQVHSFIGDSRQGAATSMTTVETKTYDA